MAATRESVIADEKAAEKAHQKSLATGSLAAMTHAQAVRITVNDGGQIVVGVMRDHLEVRASGNNTRTFDSVSAAMTWVEANIKLAYAEKQADLPAMLVTGSVMSDEDARTLDSRRRAAAGQGGVPLVDGAPKVDETPVVGSVHIDTVPNEFVTTSTSAAMPGAVR